MIIDSRAKLTSFPSETELRLENKVEKPMLKRMNQEQGQFSMVGNVKKENITREIITEVFSNAKIGNSIFFFKIGIEYFLNI